MRDQQLLRYNRQIMLPEIDIAGQQALCDAHVMIVGLGGLGSPAAMYLASSGVGKLSLLDFDQVELSNLQRQIIHHNSDINKLKVLSAKETLLALNPEIEVFTYSTKFSSNELAALLVNVDILLDCSDNFATRYVLNDLAQQFQLPLVSGAAIGFEGQISVFDFREKNSPCYRCLYGEGEETDTTCANNGVLGPLVGIIGSMQALEAIKLITKTGKSLSGSLLVFDGLNCEWRKLTFQKDTQCISCSTATRSKHC
jgi:molybdopterin-synthase adenylyltransferase